MVIEESRIKFEFPDNCRTIQFDNTRFYRKRFNSLPGSKGVDFISMDKEYAAFIEIKNCLGDEGNCRWRIFPNNQKRESSHTEISVEGRNSLDIEVPEKMAMTLAALSGVLSFGDADALLEEIAEGILLKYLKEDKKKIYVILFLEGDFGGHTRSKKMIMSDLQRSMRAKLRWLHCRVSVVDSSTYHTGIFKIVNIVK